MNKRERKYIFLIMIIFIAACIETDIYLPAFPDMMEFFTANASMIQSVLTWNFIGIVISGPFYGPLSDSFGRKKPLMIALGLFLIGSIFTIWADQFDFLLFGRILQGLGSGGCFTLGTAIIFDVFIQKKAIHALNLMNSIVPFIMAAAPLLGGYLNYVWGFRSNFLAIGIVVLLSFIISLLFFDETLPKTKRTHFKMKKIFHDFKQVCSSIAFWQLTLVISLVFAGYLAFLSEIAVLYVVELGVSKAVFPFYQGAVLIGYLIASLTCSRLIDLWGVQKIKRMGLGMVILGGAGLGFATLISPRNPLILTSIMLPYAFGFIWMQTPYVEKVMDLFPNIKGIVASVLTSARLLLTATVIGLSSIFYNKTIYPLAILMIAIVIVITLIILKYEKKASS